MIASMPTTQTVAGAYPELSPLDQAERDAADRVAALEAEIAGLPAAVEAAVEAGDETALIAAEARERILQRQLERARGELREAKLEIVRAQITELTAVYQAGSGQLAEYELAELAYADAVGRLRDRLRSVHQRLTAAEAVLFELRAA